MYDATHQRSLPHVMAVAAPVMAGFVPDHDPQPRLGTDRPERIDTTKPVMAGLDPAIYPRQSMQRAYAIRSFRGGWPGQAQP